MLCVVCVCVFCVALLCYRFCSGDSLKHMFMPSIFRCGWLGEPFFKRIQPLALLWKLAKENSKDGNMTKYENSTLGYIIKQSFDEFRFFRWLRRTPRTIVKLVARHL